MKVRIGIAESSKVVELEVDDTVAFESSFTEDMAGDSPFVWVEDAKKRRVGIPRGKVAYVEIETDDSTHAVGFGRPA